MARRSACGSETARRRAMISTEELRERRGRFVANASGDLGYSIVAGFDQRGGLLHPLRDQITVHGLANGGGKAACERRAAQAHVPPELAESPRLIRPFTDQLKGLSRVRVSESAQACPCPRPPRAGPPPDNLDEPHFAHSR